MLTVADTKTFREYFPTDPHPFVSPQFIALNSRKTDEVVYLTGAENDIVIGIVAGIKDKTLLSPFSAPFGGFHFRRENVYIGDIDRFLNSLKEYIIKRELDRIEIIIPPDLYHPSFNAKTINSLFRSGFRSSLPEITNWVDLECFNGIFSQKNSREYYRQAERNRLSFGLAENEEDKRRIYELICENRARFGRSIFMTINDILEIEDLWPVDFFKILTPGRELVASGIFYRFHPRVCYAVFWGDNETGRPLRAMDFLSLNIWKYYKEKGYRYIDLGISTESGNPNEGLLRFKETHEAISSLRRKFTWSPELA